MYKKIINKIRSLEAAVVQVDEWRKEGFSIIWTNGCFDLLHFGHIKYLCDTADLGDKLIVGVNSDASVSLLKGPDRPILDEATRTLKLAALAPIDLVVIYNDPTPISSIVAIKPDVLVKGGDYDISDIVGAPEVLSWGGRVLTVPFEKGHSTTQIIKKIQSLDHED